MADDNHNDGINNSSSNGNNSNNSNDDDVCIACSNAVGDPVVIYPSKEAIKDDKYDDDDGDGDVAAVNISTMSNSTFDLNHDVSSIDGIVPLTPPLQSPPFLRYHHNDDEPVATHLSGDSLTTTPVEGGRTTAKHSFARRLHTDDTPIHRGGVSGSVIDVDISMSSNSTTDNTTGNTTFTNRSDFSQRFDSSSGVDVSLRHLHDEDTPVRVSERDYTMSSGSKKRLQSSPERNSNFIGTRRLHDDNTPVACYAPIVDAEYVDAVATANSPATGMNPDKNALSVIQMPISPSSPCSNIVFSGVSKSSPRSSHRSPNVAELERKLTRSDRRRQWDTKDSTLVNFRKHVHSSKVDEKEVPLSAEYTVVEDSTDYKTNAQKLLDVQMQMEDETRRLDELRRYQHQIRLLLNIVDTAQSDMRSSSPATTLSDVVREVRDEFHLHLEKQDQRHASELDAVRNQLNVLRSSLATPAVDSVSKLHSVGYLPPVSSEYVIPKLNESSIYSRNALVEDNQGQEKSLCVKNEAVTGDLGRIRAALQAKYNKTLADMQVYYENEIKNVDDRLDLCTKELTIERDNIHRMGIALDTQHRENATLRDIIRRKEEDDKLLREEMSSLRLRLRTESSTDTTTIGDDLLKAQERIRQLESQLDESVQRHDYSSAMINDMKMRLEKLRSERRVAAERDAHADEAIGALKSQLDGCLMDLEKAHKSANSQNTNIERLMRENSKLAQDRRAISFELDSVRDKMQRTIILLEQSREENAAARGSMNSTALNEKVASRHTSKLQSRVKDLERENERLRGLSSSSPCSTLPAGDRHRYIESRQSGALSPPSNPQKHPDSSLTRRIPSPSQISSRTPSAAPFATTADDDRWTSRSGHSEKQQLLQSDQSIRSALADPSSLVNENHAVQRYGIVPSSPRAAAAAGRLSGGSRDNDRVEVDASVASHRSFGLVTELEKKLRSLNSEKELVASALTRLEGNRTRAPLRPNETRNQVAKYESRLEDLAHEIGSIRMQLRDLNVL